MKFFKYQYFFKITLLWMGFIASSHAHLMTARHGTLNITDDGAYMVLSLPISAFNDLDSNGDNEVSMVEFNRHRADIVARVKRNIRLSTKDENYSLQGIMLSPELHHNSSKPLIDQVVVMGKFMLDSFDSSALHFYVALYGKPRQEQLLKITTTRQSSGRKQTAELTPESPVAILFFD